MLSKLLAAGKAKQLRPVCEFDQYQTSRHGMMRWGLMIGCLGIGLLQCDCFRYYRVSSYIPPAPRLRVLSPCPVNRSQKHPKKRRRTPVTCKRVPYSWHAKTPSARRSRHSCRQALSPNTLSPCPGTSNILISYKVSQN